ncbi:MULTISPECIES: hypothetical protein [Bradyrhizobium]|uniref:Uncharacterized protein n=1 Tax=Bradyrhizobium arachidis TaxID=858423 RepID=A0AAE7NXI4_9BRAD|nr:MULTISPECIES: hypothetical protein [Bradyrhizobium]QOG22644.1 hypothetical protein FOM02_40535 [Bradyrhizobium sp. SEMIA]QOZ72005.1 hypothetical protein WN72_41250 [Bradyrhizobium arachidis]UFW48336.1 hypothetical protein BaraCB756_39760 [Bradyrhizobium arachidis]SFV19651.1 hypothetical protein SAMN05192541_1578 [Bradyrhizobium arachidis]
MTVTSSIEELVVPLRNALLYPILFFVVLFVVFHVYVYVARPGARFLKKVDYAWLALAALSIVSAASDQRRMLAQSAALTGANWFTSEAVVPVQNVHFMRKLICETPWNVDDKGRAEIASECSWYSNLEKSWSELDQILQDKNLPAVERATKAAHQIQKINVTPDVQARWASDAADLTSRVANAKQSATQYLTIVGSIERSTGELILIYFLPYLVGAAVALRFAKTTGELRLNP